MLTLRYFFSLGALLLVAGVIAYFAALHFDFNAPAACFLVSLAVLPLTYFADKIRIRLHDRRILAKAESFSDGRPYRNPEWRRKFAAYEVRHPLRQLSRGGVTSLVRRFYRLSPLNVRAAILMTVIIYGFIRLNTLTDGVGLNPAAWDDFLLWNLGLPALIFALFFAIAGFFTGAPGKVWLKRIRRSRAEHKSDRRGGVFSDPEMLFDSARYLSAGESLFVFGKSHLLMANPDGVMAVPWSSITQVTRAVCAFPDYLRLGHGERHRYYCGLKLYRGVIITFRHPCDAPDMPKDWQGAYYENSGFQKEGACYYLPEITEDAAPDSRRETELSDAAPPGRLPGYPVPHAEFFPLNEFQMQIFIAEICRRFRLSLKEPCDFFKKSGATARGHDFGHYDLSDYF